MGVDLNRLKSSAAQAQYRPANLQQEGGSNPFGGSAVGVGIGGPNSGGVNRRQQEQSGEASTFLPPGTSSAFSPSAAGGPGRAVAGGFYNGQVGANFQQFA